MALLHADKDLADGANCHTILDEFNLKRLNSFTKNINCDKADEILKPSSSNTQPNTEETETVIENEEKESKKNILAVEHWLAQNLIHFPLFFIS